MLQWMLLLHGRSPEHGERGTHKIRSDNERMYGLINNAGTGAGPPGTTKRQESKDGYELRFAINYLTPFLLTSLLQPRLHVFADCQHRLGGAVSNRLRRCMLECGYKGMRAYSQSKLASIMLPSRGSSRRPATR
ncbi:MAG: hypothetical protein JOZ19_01275 [Rubrobacter sp.]|nr:hypothetical protein [Rubrobacter sp.]